MKNNYQTFLSLFCLMSFAIAAQAGPSDDLEKCEELRPRACGQPGTPTCKSVQEEIDACKLAVKEAVGRKTNKK